MYIIYLNKETIMKKEFNEVQEATNTAREDVSEQAKNSKTGFKNTMSSGTTGIANSYSNNPR